MISGHSNLKDLRCPNV